MHSASGRWTFWPAGFAITTPTSDTRMTGTSTRHPSRDPDLGPLHRASMTASASLTRLPTGGKRGSSRFAAPLILLAQTRQADRDKAHADADAQHREALAEASLERQELAAQHRRGGQGARRARG